MVQFPSSPDVVIVGAGVAGIGASLALTQLGVPHIVLESKQRVGGRAYSDESCLGHLWDHGCHWFHSADVNILRKLALAIGHDHGESDRNRMSMRFSAGEWHRQDFDDDPVWQQLDRIPESGSKGPDQAASQVLDTMSPLYPVVRTWCQLIYSADPEELSCHDAAAYSDSHVNIPVRAGYGALVARMARGLPIRLGTKVTAIEVIPDGVSVATSEGVLKARSCILAVPARVMEKGFLKITPSVPPALENAFAAVPLGYGEKIAISFDKPVLAGLGAGYGTIFDPPSADTALMFELHPFGRPLAICHVGGSIAQSLLKDGEPAMIELALDNLVKAFGGSIRKHVGRTAVTQWTKDPEIGGAYSCAKPGKAKERMHFREPLHERIFMAGEHTHPHYFATAHGAYESGIRAAEQAAALCGFPKAEIDPLKLAA
ncbi:MAG: FAD-dependent oxidoreductase [Rhizobiales bacterium]|nr:FAD-dependent oxidoreductase [Hyphomicrobiales bacterium]